jgi:putative membrane protein (TIGR04086 family)
MQEKEHSRFYYILKGTVTAILITVPIFLLISVAITLTEFPEEYLSPAVFATVIVSIVVSAFVSTASAKDKGWFNGTLVGLIYMAIAVILRWYFEGGISFSVDILTTLLTGTLIGSISGMAGLNLGTHLRKRPKPKPLSSKPVSSYTGEKPYSQSPMPQ